MKESNKNAIDYWEKIAGSNPSAKSTKVNAMNDFTQYDADFILKYCDSASEILDLASGSGLIINKIYPHVKSIVAVEKFENFSKFIHKPSNIIVVNSDIKYYEPNRYFDIITMFGVAQYFNEEEILGMYKRYGNYLKATGKIIIKNQFGVKEDVLVSGYSEELKMDYFSHYRHVDKEVKILENAGYRDIEVIDIYPPECNRWDNTHFYAIIADK